MTDFDFRPFNGFYVKSFYDVRLPDGTIIHNCWPNAGVITATDGSGREWMPGTCECKLVGLEGYIDEEDAFLEMEILKDL